MDIQQSPLYAWLSHPLLLLGAGAWLSSYLIPNLTRRWQDHQKALELKIALVGEISEAVTSLIMSVQFAVVRAESQSQEEFDEAYRFWEVRSAVLESKLCAYFPDTALGADWANLCRLMTDFYALAGIREPDARSRRLQQILERARIGPGDAARTESDPRGHADWLALKESLLSRKKDLVLRILAARMITFV